MTSRNNRLESTIDLAELYTAMLEDIAVNYPTSDQLEFKRDSKRVFQQSKSRGLAFFMIDLPELDKALLRSLDQGRLLLEGLPHSRGKHKGAKVPRLFRTLWLRLFDEDGHLLEDADAYSLRFLRQLLQAAKKSEVEYSAQSLYATVKEFYDDEYALPQTPPFWDEVGDIHPNSLGHLNDLDVSDVFAGREPRGYEEQRGKRLLDSVQRISDRVASELGYFFPEQVRGKHGPGAVSELPKSKYKYDFGRWSPNLEGVFDYEDFAVANITHVEYSVSELGISFSEESSRLIPVPKTLKGPRLIAAEPISHQWIQQGVANLVRERSVSTVIGPTINFFDQRPSQDAALEASALGTRATIDLKSASDRLTCYVVQRLFRRNHSLLKMMRACRTRFLSNEIDLKQQRLLRLRKFATMGSALTFPIQSIAFAMISLGVGAAKHPTRSLRTLARSIRIFGDDIIIPKEWVPDLQLVLDLLGLKVNAAKSFWTGRFRESCGMDAYAGVDVTPVRIRNLKREQLGSDELTSMVDVSNNFHLRGYWRTAAWMLKTVQQMGNLPVVSLSSELPGVITFTKENRREEYQMDSSVRRLGFEGGAIPGIVSEKRVRIPNGNGHLSVPIRWSSGLQQVQVRIRTLNERARSKSIRTGSPGLLLQYFTEQSVRKDFYRETFSMEARQENDYARQADLSHLDRKWSRCGCLSDRANESLKSRGHTVVRMAWVPIERWVG